MKTKLLILLSLTLTLHAYADSATWNLNPVSGGWTDPLNWTPATVPNGPADTATFGVSNTTSVFINHFAIEVEGIVFEPGAGQYDFSVLKPLTISGTGITNNSGIQQFFVITSLSPVARFINSATAGSGAVLTNDGSNLEFHDSSSAGSAIVVTFGSLVGGRTTFFDQATPENATFMTNFEGITIPRDGANATFINEPGVGNTPGGETYFGNGDRAGNATLIARGEESRSTLGGMITFDSGSTGGTARVELFNNGQLYLPNAGAISLGSIEGDGIIELGDSALTVGNNNLSTVFAGHIRDEVSEGSGGTLIKEGSGTLTLTSESFYRNGTVVLDGTLIVGSESDSATGTRPVNVNGGILGGNGIIAGAVTIGTGNSTGAFLAPAVESKKQRTLTLQSNLTLQADATYSYTFKATNTQIRTNLVEANGVTINGATIRFKAKTEGTLASGTVLTVLSNTGASPISGTFSNLPDGAIVTIGGNNFQASYEGGDGNDLTLTVVP